MMSRRPYWCSKQILWELDSSYVKNFSCSHKFAWLLATWENTLYTKNVKFERDLWTTNEEYMQSRLILQTFGLNCRIPCHLFACHWIRIASIVLCFVLQRTPTNENNGGTLFGGVFSSCSSMLTFWCGQQEEPAVLISRLIITHASHVRNQLSFGLPLECIERNLITRFWTFKHSQSRVFLPFVTWNLVIIIIVFIEDINFTDKWFTKESSKIKKEQKGKIKTNIWIYKN